MAARILSFSLPAPFPCTEWARAFCCSTVTSLQSRSARRDATSVSTGSLLMALKNKQAKLTCMRRFSGKTSQQCATPSSSNPLTQNQSAVLVVKMTSVSNCLDLATCST